MAIKLIRESERNTFEYMGSKFYYRRISVSKSMMINKKHNRRGIVDTVAAGLDILEWCLLGWDEVLDENDQPIPFETSLVKDLPDEVVSELTPLLREASPEHNSLGNSNAS